MDKAAFRVVSLHEQDPLEETHYWLSRPVAERFAALEQLRQVMYGYDPTLSRLQRVFETAQREKG